MNFGPRVEVNNAFEGLAPMLEGLIEAESGTDQSEVALGHCTDGT